MRISRAILSVVAARTLGITVARVVVLPWGSVLLRFLDNAFWGYHSKTKACRATAAQQMLGVFRCALARGSILCQYVGATLIIDTLLNNEHKCVAFNECLPGYAG
jgi:hypothetical protein